MIKLKEATLLHGSIVDYGWGVTFDELNIMLVKIGINTKEDSKKYLENTYSTEGYYPNLSALIRAMYTKELCSLVDIEKLEGLQQHMDDFCKGIWVELNKLKKEVV